MANFVLVHGAFHWGACFQKLGAELIAAGHHVAMPDLASHGFDSTPSGSVADMAQYTEPVRRLIDASSEKVILLGHSLGGATCNFLGEQCTDKIATLVYLAGVLMPNGVSQASYFNVDHEPANPKLQIVTPGETGLQLNIGNEVVLKEVFFGDCNAHDIAIAMRNLQHEQPYAPIVTPCTVTPERFGTLRRVYIECLEDRALPIGQQRQMQKDSPGSEVFTLNTSHSPFFSAPADLAEILLHII